MKLVLVMQRLMLLLVELVLLHLHLLLMLLLHVLLLLWVGQQGERIPREGGGRNGKHGRCDGGPTGERRGLRH